MLVKPSVMELLIKKETYYVFLQCFMHKCVCGCKKRSPNFKKMHRRKLLSPTENKLLKRLVSSPTSLWHHTMSPCHTVCINYASQLFCKNSVVVCSAGSGMCELTNQSRLCIREWDVLKRQERKQRGGDRAAAPDSLRKQMCFLTK